MMAMMSLGSNPSLNFFFSSISFSSFLAGSTTQFGYAVLPFAAQTVCLPLFGLLPWKSAEIFLPPDTKRTAYFRRNAVK